LLDTLLSPATMAVVVVLYAYDQLQSLIGWTGAWRGLSLLILLGELFWVAYTNGSHNGPMTAAVVLGCAIGLALLAAMHFTRALLRSLH
jgi:hypothetical protein